MANDPEADAWLAAAKQDKQQQDSLTAKNALLGVSNVQPQAATTALKAGPVLGVSPSVAMYDPQNVQAQAQAQEDSNTIDSNPGLASAIAKQPPAAVAAVKDDLPQLSQIFNRMGANFAAPFADSWKQLQVDFQRGIANEHASADDLGAAALKSARQTAITGSVLKDALFTAFGATGIPGLVNSVVQPVAQGLAQADEALAPGSSFKNTGLFSMPWDQGQNEKLYGVDAKQQRIAANIGDYLWFIGGHGSKAFSGEGAAGKPSSTPGGGDGPVAGPAYNPGTSRYATDAEGHVVDHNGDRVEFPTARAAAQWVVKEGHSNSADQIFSPYNDQTTGNWTVQETGLAQTSRDVPQPGVNPGVDAYRVEVAKQDEQSIAELEKNIADSATHQRTPEVMQSLLEDRTQGSMVQVDPQQLVDLYQQGHTPFADMVPQIQDALQTGLPLQVPLSRYLTEVAGQPFADELRKGTTFRDGGVSVNAATELNHKEPEEVADTARLAAANPSEQLTPEEKATQAKTNAATVEGVVKQIKALYLNKLFATPEAAGMTPKQFEGYSNSIEGMVQRAVAKIQKDVSKKILAERKPEYQAALKENTHLAEQELAKDPVLNARSQLLYGETPLGAKVERLKFDRARAIAEYGEGVVNSLPKQMFAQDKKVSGQVETYTYSADDVAEMFGLSSGEELLRELRRQDVEQAFMGAKNAKEHFKMKAKDLAEGYTRHQLGYSLDPQAIMEAAKEAVSGFKVTDFLERELRAIHKLLGEDTPLDVQVVRDAAVVKFQDMSVNKARNLQAFERASGSWGAKAETALLAGKTIEAFQFKQKQLMVNHMLQQAHGLVRELTVADKKFKLWAKPGRSIDPMVNNYIQELLKLADYNVRRSVEELREATAGKTLGEYIQEQNQLGPEIPYIEAVPGSPFAGDVNYFRGFRDMLFGLNRRGKTIDKIMKGKQAQDYADFKADVMANFKKLGFKLGPDQQQGWVGQVGRGMLAPNIRMEQLLQEADLNDLAGPLSRAVTDLAQEAKARENDMEKKLSDAMDTFLHPEDKALADKRKAWMGTMSKKMNLPALIFTSPVTGVPSRIIRNRGNLVRAMTNMGTIGNYTKFIEGYKLDRKLWEDTVNKHATKEDWDFVQHIWDAFASLRPEISKEYYAMNGVRPNWIEGRSVLTPFGIYRGDYVPVRYDPLRSTVKDRFDGDTIFGNDYSSAYPTNSYTKNRTNYVAPLDLDFENLAHGFSEVIHDIAFRRAIIQISKVLSDPDIVEGIRDNFGKEFSDQLRPWVEYMAQERINSAKGTAWWANFLREARMNATYVGLGYRVSSALIHGSVAGLNSVGEVGVPGFTAAAADLIRPDSKGKAMQKFVLDNSPEIRHRLFNMDQDIRGKVTQIYKEQGFFSTLQEYGFHMLAYTDLVSTMPTWLAAYRAAIADPRGFTPLEASAMADRQVRNAHGAGASVDVPAWLRSGDSAPGEAGRQFMMFLSTQNHSLNRLWSTGRSYEKGFDNMNAGEWAGAKRDFGRANARTLAYIILPAIAIATIKSWEEHRNINSLKADDLVKGLTHVSLGAIPGVGMLLNSLESMRHDPGTLTTGQAIQATVQTGHDAIELAKLISGKNGKMSKKWVQNALSTAGYWGLGVPGQAATTTQYLWDFSQGHEKPPTTFDGQADAIYGHRRNATRND
jgi:hypothetical protein